MLLSMVIPLAAQVGFGALQFTRLPKWGLAPSKCPLFMVIPPQVTRIIVVYWYGDPADCPGGDRRPKSYQAAQVGIGTHRSYRFSK